MARRRVLTAVAVTTMALAIGAATAIFGVVDGVLFRSLPYREPGRLIAVWQTIPAWRSEPILAAMWDHVVVSYSAFTQWRAGQTSFTAVGAWSSQTSLLTSQSAAEQVQITRASPSLFDALGVHPVAGRTFLPGEDVLNGPRVTLLSYDNWQARFGGRRDVIGTLVGFDSLPYQIVGVLPEHFALQRGVRPTPFFVPAGQDSNDVATRMNHSYRAIGRLAPGVTLERAATEADRLLGGATEKRGINLVAYEVDLTRQIRRPLFILLGAVGLLVLIACVNIATLLLGEAVNREQEMGARIALGATRARLVRQLLTESLLLAAAGGVFGSVLAFWMTKGLVALAPAKIPGIQAAHVDARVLLASAIGTAVTGVLFGLAPALGLSGIGHVTIRAGGQSAAGRARLQRIMIAAELGLSVVLLVGAGLLSRSLRRLTSVDPGFRSDHMLMVRLAVPRNSWRDDAAFQDRYARVLARLASLPGVSAATGASPAPFDGGSSSSTVRRIGADSSSHEAQQRVVVPNFFGVTGIPVVRGRAFDDGDRDGAPLVAIISKTLAALVWPNESPIGKQILYQRKPRTVVGVVGDTKTNNLSSPDMATIYTPQAQRSTSLTLLVRTHGDPASLVPSVREAIRSVVPDMPVTAVESVESRIRQSFGEERFRTMIIDLFGALAAVLTAVGIYGVTTRAVSRRTREVGIRVALGATTESVIRLIVAGTLGGAAIGVVAGLIVSTAAARLLAPYLFGITPYDPATFAEILAGLTALSVVASWIPARKAGTVQPALVLRGE